MLLRTVATLGLLKTAALVSKALAVTTIGNKNKIWSSQKYLCSIFYPQLLENMQQTGLIVEMEFHIQQKFQHSTLP
jgi:hypothetical protein